MVTRAPRCDSKVEIAVTQGKTYFIKAGAAGNTTGKYKLFITTDP